MGGPWVGDLYLNNHIISKNVIVDNLIFDNSGIKLFFIKYHKTSRWANQNYFSIRYLEIDTNSLFEIDSNFDMIFLKKFTGDNHLIYYLSFHDNNNKKKRILNIEGVNKKLISFDNIS